MARAAALLPALRTVLPRLVPPLACALASLALLLWEPLPVQMLRNAVFDQYQRWQPRSYQTAPVRIVDIDEASLRRLGQWPWPRTRMAELVERLRAAGAASIVFDVVFAEPDRTSPAAMAALWQLRGEAAHALAQLPDHDQRLARALAPGGVVLGRVLEPEPNPDAPPADAGGPYRFVLAGPDVLDWLQPYEAEVPPLPALRSQAAGLGALSFMPDSDGVVRHVPVVMALQGRPVPSLAAEALRVAQGVSTYVVRSAEGTGVQELRIGHTRVPTTAHGEVWLHYSPPVPGRYLPAWEVLQGPTAALQLPGQIVLVGSSAQGLMDLRTNALGQTMPGVEAHAQLIEQLLGGDSLTRPSWAAVAEALALLLSCLLVGAVALSVPAVPAAACALAVLAALGAAGWLAYAQARLLLDMATPSLALALTFVLCSLLQHRQTERRQRFVRQAFARYVSPNRVRHLVQHPEQLALGGQRQHCSFVFTDLAGFTGFMEQRDPAQAVALLNAYLDGMIAIAFRHQGTLDRIVGDGMAIMFSAPVQQPEHCALALACALELDAFAERYAQDLQARGIPWGTTRIGVHTGEVIVGNFGGSTLFDYRALGDPVNTASRLEGANRALGTRICVSAATLQGAPDVRARPVGALRLPGRTQALQVYEPVASQGESGRAPWQDYCAAYALLQAGDGRARTVFGQLQQAYPADPLVQLHMQRLLSGETGTEIWLDRK